MSTLHLRFLGPPQVERDAAALTIDRSKALALLAYLALNPQGHVREALAAMLWPEADSSRAFAYLRRALWTLNEALGEDWIEAEEDTLRLALEAGVELDVAEFRRLLDGCLGAQTDCTGCLPRLERAAALYRDDFLAGFGLRDSPAFDDWQRFQAEDLRRSLARALQQLATCYAATGQPDAAIDAARRWVALDPFDEAAQRGLIEAYARAGQRSAALRQYDACRDLLQQELGVAPQPETRALMERVRGGSDLISESDRRSARDSSTLSSARSPVTSARKEGMDDRPRAVDRAVKELPQNLPDFLPPFIGREEEQKQALQLLGDPACRVLTLVGPGGIGKTRLSLRTAERTLDELAPLFPDGVFFVPLAPLTAPDSVIGALAEAIGFNFIGGYRLPKTERDPQKAQLLDYLRSRRVLLVLDNFEHLMPAAPLLEELAVEAPGVKLLVTSRQRLNLALEWVLEIGGMAFPHNGVQHPLEAYSAVQLFLQSAQRARVGYRPAPEDEPYLVQICRLVEGAPLAIELAAVWVRSLSCREIAAEIARNLDFLADPKRRISERHQSLRAAFEHSWTLLSEPERAAFTRVSVFAGAFTRQAAQQVAQASLPLLTALVDKSLLRHDPSGRYEMHELLKQYAREKLAQQPVEERQVHAQHASYFADELERLLSELRGPEQMVALQTAETLLEDARSAWSWCMAQGRVDLFLPLGMTLLQVYNMRNRPADLQDDFRTAANWLRRQLEKDSENTAKLHLTLAFLLLAQSHFSGHMGAYLETYQLEQAGFALLKSPPEPPELESLWIKLCVLASFGIGFQDEDAVYALYQRCLQALERDEEWWLLARAQSIYAGFPASFHEGKRPSARSLYTQSQALFKTLGDRWSLAQSLNVQAFILINRGEYELARRLTLESLSLHQDLGEPWMIVGDQLNLGQIAAATGDYAAALDYYQKGLEHVRQMGNRRYQIVFLSAMGYVDYLQGNFERAERRHSESLALARELRNRHGEGMALANLGDIARGRQDFNAAESWYQQALAVLEETIEDWGITVALKKLGMARADLGKREMAEQSYLRGLGIAKDANLLPEILDIFVRLADLLQAGGRTEQAVRLLACSLDHPAASQAVKEDAQAALNALAERLPAAKFEAARRQGAEADPLVLAASLISG